MTRFDADTPGGRTTLFLEAVQAHRERSSPFLTVEAALPDGTTPGGDDPLSTDPDPGAIAEDVASATDDPHEDGDPPPWIQFSGGTINLDCTDEELDRLKGLLEEFPAFRIDELTSPEDAEGTNVRVTARADANRIAGFLDRAFRTVYGLPEDYRAWVVEV